MNNVRYIYIRDAKYEPIGCVAITLNRSKNRVEYGLSMRNPADATDASGKRIRFNRTVAQDMARKNLEDNPQRAYITSEANMHEVTMSVFMDIIAQGTASSGARRFAKRWLRTVDYIY